MASAAAADPRDESQAAYHRMVFRQHQKEHLVRAANVMALLGLATVALSISAAVMLVVSYVTRAQWAGAVIAACVVCMFGGLWFAFPLSRRRPERT
ncbi:MAG: DUF6328 family protein [Streptosporangiaceae bacterium]|jgi:uncharacterized membrane-anchored protein YjiN (DUF445 family)